MGPVVRDADERTAILDLGCGDGHFAAIAYDRPIDVGIDVRSAELREAARCGIYRNVALASATALPFGEATFGLVVSNCAIEHIPDIDAVLSEVARVLRSGGVFATTVPSEYFAELLLGSTLMRRLHLHRAARAYGRFFNRISFHHHVYGREEWRGRLAEAGLDVVEHQYYFSPAAHRLFDASHYLGVSHLLARKLTGRWVIHRWQSRPFERWMRRYYEEPFPVDVGAYSFIKCVRTAR